ncbi:MAG: hypothetical protein M5R40_16490 [Anaerolineae bacterium]|nr:hypothetical protein [Anaerolineae bacterium]
MNSSASGSGPRDADLRVRVERARRDQVHVPEPPVMHPQLVAVGEAKDHALPRGVGVRVGSVEADFAAHAEVLRQRRAVVQAGERPLAALARAFQAAAHDLRAEGVRLQVEALRLVDGHVGDGLGAQRFIHAAREHDEVGEFGHGTLL